MTGTIITVQGTASEWFEAERATINVTVSHDGPKREPVFEATTSVGAQVTAVLSELEGSAITRWSSDRVSVWSNRPWNNDGKQLAPVYYAALSASARFQDFDALSAFVERFATVTGVTIASITWDLTEERRLAVTSDIQSRAVHDATVKATTYARAAGLSAVTPVAIADPGMLGDGSSGAGPGPMARGAGKMMMAMDAQGGGTPLTFTPDRIEVSASVDARFLAS
ncbi:SIMPL domain-containing protein [Pseudolysinimonas sp.]|uniref:SIMPL domain-containing protein n=1 Tax=Pseudolysinimonas sp. TaxID=2680009 RepID=UPI00286BB8BE|nr:SIMPL domain-containing protein [Pseudolysinimonas sp.]